MKAKELIKLISDLAPDDDTDIDILLIDRLETDFLDILKVVHNADCSGINAIGINVKRSHKLGRITRLNWYERLELTNAMMCRGIGADVAEQVVRDFEKQCASYKQSFDK